MRRAESWLLVGLSLGCSRFPLPGESGEQSESGNPVDGPILLENALIAGTDEPVSILIENGVFVSIGLSLIHI